MCLGQVMTYMDTNNNRRQSRPQASAIQIPVAGDIKMFMFIFTCMLKMF